ncbi:MAG: exodeoxyribonuclease VII large subunit [Deltaproteobacteria bacterium]
MGIENNNNRFFNLSDITSRVQAILQPHMGKHFWVKAEIASGRERGGSFYCDLVETDGNGKIIAQIRCTIWNRDLDTIKRVFREHDLELKLDNGTVVGFQCSLQYSPQYSLSLKAVAADPTFALGELELRKKQIIDRLNKEGLFEINKRLSVPLLPQRIGLVASKDSAGYNDILKTFQTSSFGFKIYLADAIVQGNQAERCVLKALDALEKLQVDLVIIARGGGSKTDLSALDNESIARRIASYTIPVWTGIGHEIDTSVLDFVANRYFKTPTAVAEEIVARYIEMQRHLEEAGARFRSTWSYRLEIENTYIYDVKVGIVQGTRKLLETNYNDLRGSAATLSSKVQERISVEKSRVAVFRRTLITSPISVITIARERCLDKRRRFTSNCNKAISDHHREISLMMNRFQMSRFLQIICQAQQCLYDWKCRYQSRFNAVILIHQKEFGYRRKRFKLEHLMALIENEKNNLTNKLATIRAADPLTSLKRGFSLVYRKDGGLLKSVEEISTGEQIQVTVSDGIIFSTVNHTIGK